MSIFRNFLSSASVVMACSVGLTGVMTTSVEAAPKKQPRNVIRTAPKAKKRVVPADVRTSVLPVRYLKGSRLARLLRVFVPRQAWAYTQIRFSPAINKILVRSRPSLLKVLAKACQQLDVSQTQFRVRVYFALPASQAKGSHVIAEAGLSNVLKKRFPGSSKFVVLRSLYVHAVNHHLLRMKMLNRSNEYDPSVHMVLHQGTPQDSDVLVDLKVNRMKAFTSASKMGTNTMFVTIPLLSTRGIAKLGQYLVVGHVPYERDKDMVQAVMVLKVERVGSSSSAKVSAKKQEPTLSRKVIARVLRSKQGLFRNCYERGLIRKPTIAGRIAISFGINSAGRVKDVSVHRSSLNSKYVESCLLRRFRVLRFPKSSGAGLLRVTYPLVFRLSR